MTGSALTDVDVCLVTWNGDQVLTSCLASLSRQLRPGMQVRIIDNGSTDNTPQLLKQWQDKRDITIDYRHENIGFAAAHNALIRQGNAPYVFILNQDVDLEAGYIDKLVMTLEKDRQLASASGLLLRMEPRPEGLSRTRVIDAAGLTIYKTHRVVERLRGESLDTAFQNAKQSMEFVFGVPATAALYRRQALQETALGGRKGDRKKDQRQDEKKEYFDEAFFSYKEDVDLAYRLRLAGWGSICHWGAVAFHVRGVRGERGSSAFGDMTTIRQRAQKSVWLNQQSYRNHFLFLKGTVLFSVTSSIWWWILAYELGRLVVLVITEPKTLLAWKDFLELWPTMHAKRAKLKATYPHNTTILPWLV